MDRIGFHIKVPEHFKDIRRVIDDEVSRATKGINDSTTDDINKIIVPRVFQIFIAEPNGFRMFFSDPELRRQFKDYIESKGIFLIVHARYLDVPWKQSPQVIGYMKKEFERALEIGAKGFVIHLYSIDTSKICRSGTDQPTWLDVMVMTFKKLNPPKDLCIYLENPASRTKCTDDIGSIYSDPHILVKIYETLANKHHFNVGLCIDTAHLFSTGVSLTTSKSVTKFFDVLLAHVPHSKIIIHLNDSASKLGSFIDRHEALGHGNIWSKDRSGLKTLLSYGFQAILEREYASLPKDYDTIRQVMDTNVMPIAETPITPKDILYNMLGGSTSIDQLVSYL